MLLTLHSFGNATRLHEAFGWKIIKGFVVYEMMDKPAGEQFIGVRHWWNELPNGSWVDLSKVAATQGADLRTLLVESPKGLKEPVKLNDAYRIFANQLYPGRHSNPRPHVAGSAASPVGFGDIRRRMDGRWLARLKVPSDGVALAAAGRVRHPNPSRQRPSIARRRRQGGRRQRPRHDGDHLGGGQWDHVATARETLRIVRCDRDQDPGRHRGGGRRGQRTGLGRIQVGRLADGGSPLLPGAALPPAVTGRDRP